MDRYYGIYRGVCFDNADPEKLGRIRARVPDVLGMQPTEWALPCRPPGWKRGVVKSHSFTDDNNGTGSTGSSTETLVHEAVDLVPRIGEGVWLMFEGGDADKAVWCGVYS